MNVTLTRAQLHRLADNLADDLRIGTSEIMTAAINAVITADHLSQEGNSVTIVIE